MAESSREAGLLGPCEGLQDTFWEVLAPSSWLWEPAMFLQLPALEPSLESFCDSAAHGHGQHCLSQKLDL